MKVLENHKLFIDADCPMCKAYSSAFVKFNMLEKSGVINFTVANAEYFENIDEDRARNEIALYDTETKKVSYGIDSLLLILSHSFPFFKKIEKNRVFRFLAIQLYKFISYNRKVVIPAKENTQNLRACVPDFNIPYRIAFIVILGLLSNVFLYQYLKEIAWYQESGTTYLEEFILLVIQFAWHALAIYIFGHKDKMLDYLGQLAVVLFVGGALLMFIKPIFFLLGVEDSTLWFGGLTFVAAIMLLMLYRRCQIIGDANHVILAWFIFRLGVGAWWFYEWGIEF